MGWSPAGKAVSDPISRHLSNLTDRNTRGLYDPSLEKDACGVGFAW
jgi:hypothetical protein